MRNPDRRPRLRREESAAGGTGERSSVRVLKKTVNDRKGAPPPEGGWRWNDGKRERRKQGDLSGTDGVQAACKEPKSRPPGVRASVVAMKRVTTVEPRDAGKWKP